MISATAALVQPGGEGGLMTDDCENGNGKRPEPEVRPCIAARPEANFGFDKDASKSMILVSFLVQKFVRRTRGNAGANFCTTTPGPLNF